MTTDKKALDPRKQFAREVEKIEGMPQTRRWRAIKNLILRMRPDIVAYDQAFIRDINEQRNNQILDTGASKSGSTRHLYSMPQWLYSALHVMDPDFTRMQEDPDQSKTINLKIARVFDEYRIARKV